MAWFPIIAIILGAVVLFLGNRLAVLGAAVGALLGIGLLYLLPSGESNFWLQFAFVGLLAVLGFIFAGVAKGIIGIVISVIGAVAGFAIVLSFFGLFMDSYSWWVWLLAVVGAFAGWMLIRRFRKGDKDWGMIILAALVGSLLLTRGLTAWFPSILQGFLGTLLFLVLAGGDIAFLGGMLGGKKAAPAGPPTATDTGSTTQPKQ